MGAALSLLRAAAGEASLFSRLGRWRRHVSLGLDSLRVQTHTSFPQIRPSVASAPTPVEVGPTFGWLFVVNNACYVEFPLQPRLDRTRDIVFGVGWAPAGSQAGRRVAWSIDVGAESDGSDVTAVTETVAVEVDVPAVAADYVRSPIIIPASVFADPDVDELHVKLTRIASTADPILPPGLHHVAVIQYLSWL